MSMNQRQLFELRAGYRPPPYDEIMGLLCDDLFLRAIDAWYCYCQSDGGRKHNYINSKKPKYLVYANTLEACLLGKSLGGIGLQHEVFHFEARKLRKWISEQGRLLPEETSVISFEWVRKFRV